MHQHQQYQAGHSASRPDHLAPRWTAATLEHPALSRRPLRLHRLLKVRREPVARQARRLLQRVRLLKQVRGARHDLQPPCTKQKCAALTLLD